MTTTSLLFLLPVLLLDETVTVDVEQEAMLLLRVRQQDLDERKVQWSSFWMAAREREREMMDGEKSQKSLGVNWYLRRCSKYFQDMHLQ